MYFSGKVGSMLMMPVESAPPRPASPEPTAKVRAKIFVTSMPMPRATRPSSTAARKRLPKRVFASTNCRPMVSRPQSTMVKMR